MPVGFDICNYGVILTFLFYLTIGQYYNTIGQYLYTYTVKTKLLFWQIIWSLQSHKYPYYANSKNLVLVKHFVGGK